MRIRMALLLMLATLPLAGCVSGYADVKRQPPLRCIEPESTNVRVEIVIEGQPATVYPDGRYQWIEGRRGERFAFRLTNNNGFPVGVVLSADGQSLTADGRATPRHPAYVIGPYETETISVWREDLRGGRELVFTSVDRSLAARKGDTRNIGVLGVLVWQLEDKVRIQPPVPMTREEDRSGAKAGRDDAAAAPGIGVGTGDRVDDQAYLTDRFRRVRIMGTHSIYYDDRAGLLRAGINVDRYPEPVPIDRRRSEPFPDYQGVRIP